MKRRGTGTQARIEARAEERARVREEAALLREADGLEQVEPDEGAPVEADVAIATAIDAAPLSAAMPSEIAVTAADAGTRLDQFLTAKLPGISRARAQLLLEQHKVALTAADGTPVAEGKVKSKYPVNAGERIVLLGAAQPKPLRAVPEDIPLDVVFEDDDIAVIHKPAGMTVHAGAGSEPEDERGRGTLVNALLHHFGALSNADDAVRPGIVHRLDKQTSGLVVIAKNDAAHAALSAAFAERRMEKHYVALVHGFVEQDRGTVNTPIARDSVRRTRMTTRGRDGRSAITHWTVRERLSTPWGDFTLLDVRIETGRTHQIRVHLSSVGHPVVGDTLYGAPAWMVARELKNQPVKKQRRTAAKFVEPLRLERNFLHAARLKLQHPRHGKPVEFHAPLPRELEALLARLRGVA